MEMMMLIMQLIKKNNVKTQIDIKTDIGLNLNLDKNANDKDYNIRPWRCAYRC